MNVLDAVWCWGSHPGRTCAHRATAMGDVKAVEQLITAGIDLKELGDAVRLCGNVWLSLERSSHKEAGRG